MSNQIFVDNYREKYGHDFELPCLKCTDAQIMACSNVVIKKTLRSKKMGAGCAKFKEYERLIAMPIQKGETQNENA